jgi:fatty-acyl-CoA synthase
VSAVIANETDVGRRPSFGTLSSAKEWWRALALTASIPRQPGRILPAVIEEHAETRGDELALVSESERFTYASLAERTRRYARWAIAQGVTKGDVVCLLMPNCPEYLAIWLGITRIGGTVALLNTNLAGPSLAHCINVAAPAHVICAAELADRINAVEDDLAARPVVWIHGGGENGHPQIDREIERHAVHPLDEAEHPPVTIEDRALYVYTSGTTGLPKAAIVSHARVMQWSHWFAGLMDVSATDRLYNCLPMYHSVGGIVAPGALLAGGGSVAIHETFSARRFWTDLVQFDCTLFQYIGELCRYLLNTDPHPLEAAHHVRMCCGNGLTREVWIPFAERFRIPRILEFYAATEGNVSLVNVEGKPGAVGRIPGFLAHRFPAALIRYDHATGRPFRDADGFCIRCAPHEAGEAIGPLAQDSSRIGSRFEGYTSADASEEKILRDVFRGGDAWVRSGDLMRKDEQGYFYFVDRIGDTFRWKGENVATREVAETIGAFPGVRDAVVYGVRIPHADGRAGMAAIVTDGAVDLADLRTHLIDRLPEYARPVFVRLCRDLDVTTTFKHVKSALAAEGYDPGVIDDPVYFDDRERNAFVRLDRRLYERIECGGRRV